MIALKKLYGDELLRLALVLSLLKANPNDYLEQETQQITAGLYISNGTDWSLENEARTLIRPTYVHPKSLDNILINYERQLFEELNSLGRYHNSFSRQDNVEMSYINRGPVLHTYLLNNVATDTAPVLAEPLPNALPDNDELIINEDGISDDNNVAHEIKVSEDDSEETQPDAIVTLSADFLSNRTESDIFAELPTRSFDVSEFFVTPDAMHIKKEPDEDTEPNLRDVQVKKEMDSDDLYSDNAMDGFHPYFKVKTEDFKDGTSVYEQNMADLQDYEGILEDMKSLKENLDYLDMKQQDNFEQYLLENTPLDAEAYELASIFEDELILDVKRERAGTSFTSTASSSGVSEMDIGAEEIVTVVPDVKLEPDEGHHSGDELTQEVSDIFLSSFSISRHIYLSLFGRI